MAGIKEQSDEEIVREAHSRFQRCVDWETHARRNALLDERFNAGDSYNCYQWDQSVISVRGDRPTLTINKTRQHVLHIVNDARQHKAQIKVTPTGGKATYEAAQVYSAIVRRIEYQSKAIDAYSTAFYHQAETGIGYVRVTTDYVDQESDQQEIQVKRVKDPKTIYLDPDAMEFDKSDMRFAFVSVDTPRDVFKEANPDVDASFPPFDSAGWIAKDNVREAEYWRKREDKDTLYRLADDSTIRKSTLPDGVKVKGDTLLTPFGAMQIVGSRDLTVPRIEWFKIAGNTITERKAWAGRYIPISPCIGEETVIDGVMDRKGQVRCLIDAQRMLNYWQSAAAEQVALQTKTPWLVDPRAIEGLETYWSTANTVNHAFLPYNSSDESSPVPIPKPERINPPTMAAAYLQGMETAKQDMMLVSGQYQADIGAPGNETSGVAIQQRQRAGENANYHFIDNQAKCIRQVGRIIVDLIPHIYDVAQVIQIMAEDGTQSNVHLDPDAEQAHQHVMPQPAGQGDMPVTPEQADAAMNDPDSPDPKIIFNPKVGRYDVEADVGPSFGTQRQEAFNALSQIMQGNPDLMQKAGDLLFKAADFPFADELAERLKRGIPPQFLGGPPPAVQQLQAQLQHTAQAAHQITQQADQEVAALKAQIAQLQAAAQDKSKGTDIDDYRAETDRLKAVAAADPVAGQVLIRTMLSQLLGMPALPVMQAHVEADALHHQSLMPPEQMPKPQQGQEMIQ